MACSCGYVFFSFIQSDDWEQHGSKLANVPEDFQIGKVRYEFDSTFNHVVYQKFTHL